MATGQYVKLATALDDDSRASLFRLAAAGASRFRLALRLNMHHRWRNEFHDSLENAPALLELGYIGR